MKTLKEELVEFVLDSPKFILVLCLIVCIISAASVIMGFMLFITSSFSEIRMLIAAILSIFFLIVFFLFFLFALNTIISDYDNYSPPKIID